MGAGQDRPNRFSTCITLFGETRDLATDRVRESNLDGRIQVLKSDYRDLNGQFDNPEHVKDLGFPDAFVRMWDLDDA